VAKVQHRRRRNSAASNGINDRHGKAAAKIISISEAMKAALRKYQRKLGVKHQSINNGEISA